MTLQIVFFSIHYLCLEKNKKNSLKKKIHRNKHNSWREREGEEEIEGESFKYYLRRYKQIDI